MDRTSPANRTGRAGHAAHDELLITRLFGGDVDEGERARAIDLMTDCRECTTLFADLGAIAEATAAMPVPARARDFRLTEADAARLSRKRRWLPAIFGPGLRRSLGGSLAALGLVGVTLTGAVSLFGGSGGSSLADLQVTNGQATALDASAAGSSAYSGTGEGPIAAASVLFAAQTAGPAGSPLTPALPAAPSAADANCGSGGCTGNGSTLAPGVAGASAAAGKQFDGASPQAQSRSGGEGAGQNPVGIASAEMNGFDARLVWLLGFGLLFAIGLAIALLPRGRRG